MELPKSYLVHNDMQELEHSLEAIILLHRKNKQLEIIPILVPYINYETIDGISTASSDVVSKILKKGILPGKDVDSYF
jgi:predicted class III extradiol MEMO1 family dioxygenase